MFYDNSSGKFVPPNGLSARALKASNTAAQAAQTAAQSAAAAAQLAAQSAAQSVRPVAQSAAQNVRPVAQSAAQNVGSASRSAAEEMSRSVRQGVNSARGWVAPRLETAADYTTDSVAPRVSGALRSTARQVRPDHSRSRSVIQVILLSIAALAGAGAVAVLIQRQRGKFTGRKDSEHDVVDVGDAGEPAAPVPGQKTSPAETTSAGVNGQASATRW